MLAVNLGTRGVDALAICLEYCNAPAGRRYADWRAANGHPDPYGSAVVSGQRDGRAVADRSEDGGRVRPPAAEAGKAMRLVDPSIELCVVGSSNSAMPTFGALGGHGARPRLGERRLLSLHTYYDPADLRRPRRVPGLLARPRPHDRDGRRHRRRGGASASAAASVIGLSVDYGTSGISAPTRITPTSTGPFKSKPPLAEDDQTMADALVVGCLLIAPLRHADRVKSRAWRSWSTSSRRCARSTVGRRGGSPASSRSCTRRAGARTRAASLSPTRRPMSCPRARARRSKRRRARRRRARFCSRERTESPLPLDARLRDLDASPSRSTSCWLDVYPDASNTPEQPDLVAPSPRAGATLEGDVLRARAAAASWNVSAPVRARAGHVVGIDFGTLSGRAVVVRVSDGAELGSAVHEYAPRRDRDAAARHRARGCRRTGRCRSPRTTASVLREAVPDGARGRPASTPTRWSASPPTSPPARSCRSTRDGTPLCRARRASRAPARVPEALEAPRRPAARRPHQRGSPPSAASRGWPRYGGRISSEWQFAKGLQLLEEDPEIYARADRWIEAADWIIWQLCGRGDAQRLHRRLQGRSTRTGTTRRGSTSAALNPDFAGFVDDKLEPSARRQLGERAGDADRRGRRLDRPARGHRRRGRQRRRPRHRAGRQGDRRPASCSRSWARRPATS